MNKTETIANIFAANELTWAFKSRKNYSKILKGVKFELYDRSQLITELGSESKLFRHIYFSKFAYTKLKYRAVA